jgi:nucleolar protein 56
MTLCLITKWFGTFLCTEEGIVEKVLAPKTAQGIEQRLRKIAEGALLSSETRLAKGKSVLVSERRLEPLGTFDPLNPVFSQPLAAEDYGYSASVLHNAALSVVQEQTRQRLLAPDLEVMQMVNAVDDLIQIANLLAEREASWSQLPNSEEKRQPFLAVAAAVRTEMERLQTQIDADMHRIAPNLSALAGPLIGARLIALAGGLERLALLPGSTIQLLGAEKALFRYKKEGGRPPKHGILFQHPLVNRAQRQDRGRRARTLAATLAIAVKADVYSHQDIHESLATHLDAKLAGFSSRKPKGTPRPARKWR